MMPRHRLAIVVSHPIQHFVHYYRELAARPEIDLKVFFCSRIGLDRYFDREMNTEIAWQMDLTGGYSHAFLPEADRIRTTGFRAVDNPSIGGALDAFRPDTVLTYGYGQMTALRALWWCRTRGVPVMMIADSERLQARPASRELLKGIVLPWLLRQYDCFLTTGDNNEAYYRHYGVADGRFFRVPFTIDEMLYRDARTRRTDIRRAFRATHGIGEHEFVALTVGKVSERKRPQDVVAVAGMLRERTHGRPIRLVMAGNGPMYDALVAKTASEGLPVTWLGFVNVDRLPEAYCAADILLHPSEADPHPLVCSEASCIGLPLLLSHRVGAAGPTDIARPGRNTLVFSCRDPEAIARILSDLSADPARMGQMGQESMAIFDELDIRKSVQGTLAALDYCASRRHVLERR